MRVLFNYHLSSEDKFENGEFLDRGKTERRHVSVEKIRLIGKEANKVGETEGRHELIRENFGACVLELHFETG